MNAKQTIEAFRASVMHMGSVIGSDQEVAIFVPGTDLRVFAIGEVNGLIQMECYRRSEAYTEGDWTFAYMHPSAFTLLTTIHEPPKGEAPIVVSFHGEGPKGKPGL